MQTLVGAGGSAESSRFLVWEVPGNRVCVQLSRDVAQALVVHGRRWFGMFRGRAEEAGGILLGTLERAGERVTIKIEESLELPCEHVFGPSFTLSGDDKDNLRRTLQQCRNDTRGVRPVGFYRTHTRRGLRLDPDDLLLFSEFFPDPEDIALVVKKRFIRRDLAAFFFGEDAALKPDTSVLQAPLGGRTAKALPAPKIARRSAKPKAVSGRPPRAPLWSSWWIQAPLLAFLLAADGLLGFFSARQFTGLMTPAAAARDPYALSLMVLEYGDNLHLTWDRDARAVTAGQGGLLLITDGAQSRSMDLTPAQLKNGSVIYRKMTSQVRFRLEVFLKERRSVSETWQSSPGGLSEPSPAEPPALSQP